MDYKKIGNFIKELLKSKGMNQEDLAKLLNITPQAVSKSLNGANTFDIANLKVISELFEVTIDDLLNGEFQTSTSTMSEQERLVKLGLKAIKSADVNVLNKPDEKEKTILHYAIQHKKPDVLEYILDNRLLMRWYSSVLEDDRFFKLLMDNNLENYLIKITRFDPMRYKAINFSKTSKELWSCEKEDIVKLLYLDRSKTDRNSGKITIDNFDLAIKFNNKKVIDIWFENQYSIKLPMTGKQEYLELAAQYFNHYFIRKFLEYVQNTERLRQVYFTIDVYHMFYGDVELLDYIIKEYDQVKITITYEKISDLLEDFFSKKDYKNLMKYSAIGSIPSKKFDSYDIEEMDMDELLFLFKAGGLPEVQYNNKESVNNYVVNMNRIIVKLTQEILKNRGNKN